MTINRRNLLAVAWALVASLGAVACTSADADVADGATLDGTDGNADANDSQVRRELGLTLRPESDIPANPLPSLDVYDVGQDRMVNFGNIFPAEQPVLLWMWAPY